MKTIFRWSMIVLVMTLIGIGIVVLFENPAVQNLLGLEATFGRGGRAAEADRDLVEQQGADHGGRGSGQGRGLGVGQGEGHGEHLDEFPSSAGWMGLVGILLRLAILMAAVVALVKFGRWIGCKLKPNGRSKAENASPS